MKILGIETSCDETAAAVVEDGRKVLSNVIHSQIDIHAEYGGVVPEVAARSHIEMILPVIRKALKEADCNWDDIDAIAVTFAPGLIGSLLIGSLAARTLAVVKNKPLYPIHHVKAHVYAGFLDNDNPIEFPILSLIVSGGHTQIVLFHSHQDYEILGQTQDDAVGEAFDKVAKIIGLPYPGGPAISIASKNGDSDKYHLPKAKLSGKYDFSFSGLKTAVLRAVQREVGVDITFPSYELSERLSDSQRNDFAASFQKVAVDTLVDKIVKAEEEYSPHLFVLAGGVAANQLLRSELEKRLSTKVILPDLAYCTDNAAMIAGLAYYESQFSQAVDPYDLEVVPSLSM